MTHQYGAPCMESSKKKRLIGLMLLSMSTFVVCAPAAFTQIISLNLMIDLNSFPEKDFTWVFPIFVAGECSSMGLCACILDRYGRAVPYLIGAVLFMISTVICAVAQDMTTFNILRFVQGFGAGIIIVACIAQIYFDVEDKKDRYMANGIMSLGFGTGMLFGIFAGPAVVDTLGWRTAFWSFVVLLAILAYPSYQVLRNGKRSDMRADAPGAIILTIWAACFVLFLQKIYNDWSLDDTVGHMGVVFLIMLFLLYLAVEVINPNSVFHRKVDNGRLVAVSIVFIVLLGVIDMAAVGFMVKTALFIYQMSVAEAAPFFLVMIGGAAITAISISHFIDRTGHTPWLILSVVLSPIALMSMHIVKVDDPSYMFAFHLFLLGLAIGCLVSMLNATIQNRTTEHNNGAIMSFAIMIRTAALWLGYNFYQTIADLVMVKELGSVIDHWNSILHIELPADCNLANLLITPLSDALKLLPGLTHDIAAVFAEGVAVGFTYGAVVIVAIGFPVALLLVGRSKTL